MTRPEPPFSAASLAQVLFGDLGLSADTLFTVAYSGGLDSHCLLHALASLRAVAPLRLQAVHVDHALQAASAGWARHCLGTCAALDVPCRVERIEVRPLRGEGVEAAAREARYAVLMRHVPRAGVLVTGHQQDDQAETVLLQLLRGAGLRGLAGMPGLAVFGDGHIARPLLGFSRAALHAYALAQGLPWIEDPSNQETGYRRNLLRQQFIPGLQQYWPQMQAALARSAAHAAEAAELLDGIAAQDLAGCRASGGRTQRLNPAPLSVPALLGLSHARRRNVLRFWLRSRGFLAPSSAHLGEIDACLVRDSKSHHVRIAWPQAEVHRYRGELHVMPPLAAVPADLCLDWDLVSPLTIPGSGRCLRPVGATGQGLARARLGAGSVQVRLRAGGETCRLPGRIHRHQLKKLLQAAGIEPWLRERLPLVYVEGELAAVADLWVCEPFAARNEEPAVALVWELC